MSGSDRGTIKASVLKLQEIGPLSLKLIISMFLMSLPATVYVGGLTEVTDSRVLFGFLASAITGLAFYLTSDRLRESPQTTPEINFDEVSGYQRKLVIFVNITYLNVVVTFAAFLGGYFQNQMFVIAGFLAFVYPAIDHWLARQQWWLSPAVLVAGTPAYLPYFVSTIRSYVAQLLSIEGPFRDRGRNFIEYLDPEEFNFELLEIGQVERS